MPKRKTVKKSSCASKRAYKSSGRCVPKKGSKRASTKRRGCYAKTRDACAAKMQTFYKAERRRRKQRKTAKSQASYQRALEERGMGIEGLRRRRRRSR